MPLKIRLARGGAKKRPYYRIVIAEATAPRDGRFIEKIGTFNPMLADDHADKLKLDQDRAKHWLSVGAQPTERVTRLLDKVGLAKFTPSHNPTKMLPKKKAQERVAAKEKKVADAAAAAAAPAPAAE